MSIRPVKRLIKSKPTLEGAGVHLRRAFGFGNTSDFDPFLLARRFPQRRSGGLSGGLSLASASRHRDDHLRPRRNRRARRQHGQPRRHRCRRRPVDDRGQRHHSPGNAQGRSRRAHARFSALGESAGVAQDDAAALPGSEGGGNPRGHRRRRHARAHGVRKILGKDGPGHRHRHRSDLSRRVRPARDTARRFPSRRRATPSPTCSPAPENSATRRNLCEVPTEAVGWADTHPPAAADNRSLVLFDRGDEVMVQAGDDGIRFLLVSGKPLEEPVAWYGPIVMNTQEQLRQAFQEIDKGTFLKTK